MMCTSNESIRLVHVFRYNLISHSLSLSFLTNLLSLFLATFNFFLLPLPSASLNFWGSGSGSGRGSGKACDRDSVSTAFSRSDDDQNGSEVVGGPRRHRCRRRCRHCALFFHSALILGNGMAPPYYFPPPLFSQSVLRAAKTGSRNFLIPRKKNLKRWKFLAEKICASLGNRLFSLIRFSRRRHHHHRLPLSPIRSLSPSLSLTFNWQSRHSMQILK